MKSAKLTAALLAVATATLACSESQGPSWVSLDPGPFIVSGPVAPVEARSARPARALLDPALVYISLPENALPEGFTVGIRNHRTGDDTTTMVINGGFDPVPLPAREGDTVVMTVGALAGGTPTTFASAVAAAAKPIVVRTSPPRHKRDVSLNAIVVIVFSEPLDPATVDTGSIRLWRGAVAVPGTVRFADAANLRVQFHPDSLLAPDTEYQLVATRVIRDLNGLTLDSTITVPFTTGNTQPASGLVLGSVSAGYLHACGITTSGKSFCWGSGILGNGDSTTVSPRPVPVAGTLTYAGVTAGNFHSCGLTVDGTIYCWGENQYGALGDGTVTDRLTPVPVAGGLTFASVSAGSLHTCGVTLPGAAYCWGLNYYGQLGDGTTTDRWVPVPVAPGLKFKTVSAGQIHSCGITVQGNAYCWGRNGEHNGPADGRVGDGTTVNRSVTVPVPVAAGLSFSTVSAGYYHSCGLTDGGTAYCWGSGTAGQMGDGVLTNQLSPAPVAGGVNFAAVSAGGMHTCGVSSAGEAYCWGANGSGELARGTNGATPGLVTGGLTFAAVSAGFTFTCGVAAAGTAYCWGANWGFQLGNGASESTSVPVKVAGQR